MKLLLNLLYQIKLIFSKDLIILSKVFNKKFHNKKTLNIHAFKYLVIQTKFFLTLIERNRAGLKGLNPALASLRVWGNNLASSSSYHICGAGKTRVGQNGVGGGGWRNLPPKTRGSTIQLWVLGFSLVDFFVP